MLELTEPDDDVGHLDAHVVDVVLRLDTACRGSAGRGTSVSPSAALRR